jgi:hypothetical protein
VLVAANYLNPSLIFASKGGAYPSGVSNKASTEGRLMALHENIILGLKCGHCNIDYDRKTFYSTDCKYCF